MKTEWEDRETQQRARFASTPTQASDEAFKPAAEASAQPATLVGQRIGAYRITQFLDSGGMGEIYLAERDDGMFNRQVAIKLIRTDLDPKEYDRMLRETRLLASLQHPNLVMLFDAGRLPDGRPYLVMEYVPGSNLRSWLKQRGAFAPQYVLEIVRQACAGLQAAHAAGVIHRDIKPDNIIVADKGGQLTVKVLDFGIAVRPDSTSVVGSQAEVAGTYLYMPPEQLNGTPRQHLTPATDLYALGLTVFEMITGHIAMRASTVPELVAKHLYQPAPLPGQLYPQLRLPLAVDTVFQRVLAKDPALRYQQATEFAQALANAYHSRSGQTTPVEPAERTGPPPFQTVREMPVVPTAQTVPEPPPTLPSKTMAAPLPTPVPPLPIPKPDPKPGFNYVWLVLLVIGLGIAGASYWVWQREAVSPDLKIFFTVQNAEKAPLAASLCELLKLDESGTPNKAGAVLCSQTTGADGKADCGATRFAPGKYLLRAGHAGYRNFEQAVQLAESRKEPGTVRVVLTLEK